MVALEVKKMWLRIALIPVLFMPLLALFAYYYGSATVYEPPYLLPILNGIFGAFVSLVIVSLAAKSYLRHGLAGAALLGCGLLVFAVVNILAGFSIHRDVNQALTAYNLGVLLSAILYLASALRVLSGEHSWSKKRRLAKLASLYGVTVFLLVLIYILAGQGMLPAFFVQGIGPTEPRQMVLLVTMLLLVCAASLLLVKYFQSNGVFYYLFALGMLLITTGMFSIFFLTSAGSALAWAGRVAQYVGSLYLLGGVVAAWRENSRLGLPTEEVISQVFAGLDDNYRTLMETSKDIIATFDRRLRYRYVNPAVEQVTGQARVGLIGKSIREMRLDPVNLGKMESCIQVVFARKTEQTAEIEYTTPQGWKTYHYTFVPQKNRSGKTVRVLATGRDISELRRKEMALAESEERLKAIFEKAPVGMARVDLEGGFIQVNDAVCQLLGYSEKELTKLTFMELTHPKDLAADLAQAERLRNGEVERYNMEKRYVRRNGEKVWTQLSVSVIRDFNGQPLHYIAVVEDIGERKWAAEALERTNLELIATAASLQAANEELNQFSYAVSHDLKAPLRAVSNYASFLQEDMEGKLQPEQEEYLSGLGVAVGQCQRLIDDLLTLGRISQVTVELGKVDLPALVKDVWARVEKPPEARLVLADGERILKCQSTFLRQILQNLIANAIKFNRSMQPEVEVGWFNDTPNQLTIYIRDNGIGIETRHHEKVFGLFQRLHSEREYPGTGLGLAIVRRAAARLNGSVRLESEPGQGATFYVTMVLEEETG